MDSLGPDHAMQQRRHRPLAAIAASAAAIGALALWLAVP
jgi:hypothetical protein